MTSWKDYERVVARLAAEQADRSCTVIPNAKLIGNISGIKRQIDVLIDSRHDDDSSNRVIVDAKKRRRPIDIKHVEEFEGMMRDVRASHGFIICPFGHTPAAKKRAQDFITIKLLPLSDVEQMDPFAWEPCSHPKCEGWVLWDANPGLQILGKWFVFATSKCDKCRRFNIWCWACGEKAALGDEAEWQCSCKGPWFWLTAIEEESEEVPGQLNAVYLLLIFGSGAHELVDRRPLR